MRVVLFVHSLASCWNHGNAHFLRGIAGELLDRGHDVRIHEPSGGWSRRSLVREHGEEPLRDFRTAFPELRSELYDSGRIDVSTLLEGADLVLVHEWNDPELVGAIGAHRRRLGGYRLLFHDTHHRSATAPHEMSRYDLRGYDGVLAYGAVIRDIYLQHGWTERAWVWHEAADTRVFRPARDGIPEADLVWVGNWGDGERSEELRRFLLEPAQRLGLGGSVYGVRYPPEALRALARAGLTYGGWLPNHMVPGVFARHRVTVHVPRRPYVESLPGIPTIRVFEALACRIPLVTSPWDDAEGLFSPGADFLVARDEDEMAALLHDVLADEGLARGLATHGLRTIEARHTCAHRVDELLAICGELGVGASTATALPA